MINIQIASKLAQLLPFLNDLPEFLEERIH